MTGFRLLMLALLFASGLARGDYRFESIPFGFAEPPWTRSDRVVGTIEVDGPLPAWTENLDLRSRITALEFFDGVRTRSLADTEICLFTVTVDARGAIIDWLIELRESPLPPPGEAQHNVTVSPFQALVFEREAGDTPCGEQGAITSFNIANASSTEGDHGLPVQPVVYRYDSAPFVTAEAPFAVGDSYSASLQFAGRIPPSRSDFEIAPFVQSAAVQPRFNPEAPWVAACSLRVDTDASGQIIGWQGVLTEAMPQGVIPPPPSPGDPRVAAWGLNSAGDDARIGFIQACEAAPIATAAIGGAWRGGAAFSVPALNGVGLALLAGLLAMLGLLGSRRGKAA